MVLFPIPGQQFTITWDQPSLNMNGPVDVYFVNISGPDDLCGNVDTNQRVNNSSYTCSGWRMSIGQKYTFTVQPANCGGTQRGPTGDPVTVCLQGTYVGTRIWVSKLLLGNYLWTDCVPDFDSSHCCTSFVTESSSVEILRLWNLQTSRMWNIVGQVWASNTLWHSLNWYMRLYQ